MVPVRKTSGGVVRRAQRKTATTASNRQPRAPSLLKNETSSSWEFLNQTESNLGVNDDRDAESNSTALSAILQPQNGPHSTSNDTKTIDPLREMAERVGREVETFAETLDKFLSSLPDDTAGKPSARFEAALELVADFRDLADEAVQDLKREHERTRLLLAQHEFSARTHFDAPAGAGPLAAALAVKAPAVDEEKAAQVARLRKWQQEADLWELFRLVLETHPSGAALELSREQRLIQLDELPPLHPYTHEADVWERFLLEDDVARERHLVKQWLERTTEHRESDLDGIVKELESRGGRNTSLWSAGWLYTRERIKGEKRLRTWPNAADSPLPQLKRSDGNESLITTLDPDAPTRQQRITERADSYSERAIWIVCWEMLRRGKSYQEICDWCEERKEGWRALSLGRTQDLSESPSSMALWRRSCYVLSESGCSNEYEAAVYGLLGGNLRPVLKVCRTFDDHLFAHYSCMLIRQFDVYVARSLPSRTPLGGFKLAGNRDIPETEEHAEQAVVDLLIRLRKGIATKAEAAEPLNTIQGYLLGNMAPSLVTTVGAMIALTAAKLHQDETQGLIERPPMEVQDTGPETVVALDPHALRIVAHMAIILRLTHPEQLEPDDLALEENVLVAYMQALRAAGKRDALPLYASQLQHARYVKVLGRVLQDVTELKEQREMLQLFEASSMDTPRILDSHLNWTLRTQVGGEAVSAPLPMLEKTKDTKLWPGQRIIVDFMPDEIGPQDEAVVNCLQWFMLYNGHWAMTFSALSAALRRCLVTGRFACARLIVEKFSYEEVSLRKSHETLGRTINMMDDHSARPGDDEERLLWDRLKGQSQSYYELELLVRAIESLAEWRAQEATYLDLKPRPTTVPSALKRAKAAVSSTMQSICNGILLQSTDEAEATDLGIIRRAYLPEVILAYNAVLHAAGNFITRDCLLESMDLSTIVARDDNGLLAAIRDSRRMRELVDAFALTSRAMLILKAEGKPWKPKRDNEGRNLGLWEIGAQRVQLADEDFASEADETGLLEA